MLTAVELANYLLSYDAMDHKKLQKLAYYSQAWFYTLYGDKLIEDEFEAWVHGPVCPTLYRKFKDYGWNVIPKSDLKIEDEHVKNFLDSINETFYEYTGDQLEMMSHAELPWKNARKGLKPWDSSNNTISLDCMKAYYSKLLEEEQLD